MVVVQTSRGLELAKVLQTDDINQPPTGELLRRATDNDLAVGEQAKATAAEILLEAQTQLTAHALPAVAIDAEVLLSGDVAICYYLGQPDIRLGPVAFDLGRRDPPLRVQFEQAASSGATLPSSNTPQVLTDLPEPLPADTTPHERRKHESNMLRGQILAEVESAEATAEDGANAHATAFSRDTAKLLEFHGVYQQSQRKAVKASSSEVASSEAISGVTKTRQLMVRVNPPGGRLSSSQLLAMFDLACEYGDATLRITARQGLQFHGVLHRNLRTLIVALNDRLISTFGACGDVVRNIVCCPEPGGSVSRKLHETASNLARQLAPAPAAYHEIWLEHPHESGAMEPLYGAAYLPNKLKFAIAAAGHNCVDLLVHDVGFLADVHDGRLAGFHCFAGGGLAVKPSDDDTFASLAQPLGYVAAGDVAAVAAAIFKLHRDNGRRDNHRMGRLRYLIHQWGIQRFRVELQKQSGGELLSSRQVRIPPYSNHLGWHTTDAGNYLGVDVPSGRITAELMKSLRGLLSGKSQPLRLTPAQNLLICNVEADASSALIAAAPGELASRMMACPAAPTCSLAVGEAERIAGALAEDLQQHIAAAGLTALQADSIQLRIAGCSNACAHPQTASIGLIATARRGYTLLLGGDATHLGLVFANGQPLADVVAVLAPVIQQYAAAALPGESFAAFCRRCVVSDSV